VTSPFAASRSDPLRPLGAIAEEDAARRLARRLLALPDDALARLAGVAAPGLLAIVGQEEDLPWVDGIRYLGRDAEAPALLLPTSAALAAPAALVERALLACAPAADRPLAVLADPLRLVPVGGARPIERSALAAWLEAER
jgi:hypothetical protein